MQPAAECAVIGAGIVGVCIAYELSKRGIDTLLIDRDEAGRGCSFGNSGAISSASVAPLAMPGVLASVPSMLGQADSPLFLPWNYLPRALPWLTRFVLASRPSVVQKSAARLAHLHHRAVELHQALANEVGVPELILMRGHLHLYRDEAGFKADAATWRLREQHDVSFQRLSREQILALEPQAPEGYNVGVYIENQATVTNPFRYVQAIFRKYMADGGRYARADVQSLRGNASTWSLNTSIGTVTANRVIVAAGAWSSRLLRPLGIDLPLETQRGYHVQFQRGATPVSRTVVLADHKAFFTPMEDGLRVGGTVEIAGLDAAPNPRRAEILARIARESFPSLVGQNFSTWMGHRPCMPDTVPVVGPSDTQPRLWLAVGHGHLGLTDSVHTASIIADGIVKARALEANARLVTAGIAE